MIRYLSAIAPGKVVLWCYLIWYLVTLCFHFDPAPRIWLNSAGISALVGIALMLSVSRPPGSRLDPWQTMRLFLMPFCVSSFSSLIKGQDYVLVLPPSPRERVASVAACLGFVALVLVVKRLAHLRQPE